jgi:cobalt-zinc-cadmium efflux system protein
MQQNITKHGSSRKRLLIALGLGTVYFLTVAIGSILSGSLALLANAGHMMLHNGALIIGIIATTFAMKEPNEKFSSGYNKVEAIGGYTNGLLLLIVSLWVLSQAFGFFGEHGHDSHEIDASLTGYVAVIGLCIHAFSVWVLYGGRHDNLCVNAAFFHIFFDVIGTLSALAVSVFVIYTGMHEADLLVAGLIGLLILYNAVRIMKAAIILLLDGTPESLKQKDIVNALTKIKHVKSVHHLVIRRKDSSSSELSAHLVMSHACIDTNHWNACRKEAEKMLKDTFNIEHCVLQLESDEDAKHHHS